MRLVEISWLHGSAFQSSVAMHCWNIGMIIVVGFFFFIIIRYYRGLDKLYR
jgi:hypothetical protein